MNLLNQLRSEILQYEATYSPLDKVHQAANWNAFNETNEEAEEFWELNTSQFWLDHEIDLSFDIMCWENELSDEQRVTYAKVLSGLTLLDTKQANRGMPLIGLHTKDELVAAVMSFMGSMENIHAKSYSAIFSTLCSSDEIQELFKWVETNRSLQFKANEIGEVYEALFNKEVTEVELFMGMAASVLLESFLFYSGFFFPLYLAGQGLMTAAGEIINLIIRDEAIHGQFIGIQAQKLFDTFDSDEQARLIQWFEDLTMKLYNNELKYTENVYGKIGLEDEVNEFVRYNANKAFDNLGFDHIFEDTNINPVVEAGLSTDTKNHDFFSVKGNGYVKAANVTPVTDETFIIERLSVNLDDELDALAS